MASRDSTNPFTTEQAIALLMSSPAEIEAIGAEYTRLGHLAAPLGPDISIAAASTQWTGLAASQFHDIFGTMWGYAIPIQLPKLADALAMAGTAVSNYGSGLAPLKSKLQTLESEWTQVHAQLVSATSQQTAAQDTVNGYDNQLEGLKSVVMMKVAQQDAPQINAAQTALDHANTLVSGWAAQQADLYTQGWNVLDEFNSLATACANNVTQAEHELPEMYWARTGPSLVKIAEDVLLSSVHAFENVVPDFEKWLSHPTGANFSQFLGDLGTIVVTVGAAAAIALLPIDSVPALAGVAAALDAMGDALGYAGIGITAVQTGTDITDVADGEANPDVLFADALGIAVTAGGDIDLAPLEKNLEVLDTNSSAVANLASLMEKHPDWSVSQAIDWTGSPEYREFLNSADVADMSPDELKTFIATTKALAEAQQQVVDGAKAIAAATGSGAATVGSVPSAIQSNQVPVTPGSTTAPQY